MRSKIEIDESLCYIKSDLCLYLIKRRFVETSGDIGITSQVVIGTNPR